MKKFRQISYLLLCLFLPLFGFTSCVYFNTFYNAKKYFKEAVRENEDNETGRPQTGKYQKSIDSAGRVLEYYPKSKYVDDALLLMGKAYYGIEIYPKAKRKCEELLTNYPDSPLRFEARLYLGKTIIAMRQIDEGIKVLNDLWVDKEVPQEVRIESQRTRADYYFDNENYYQALLEYTKILEVLKNPHERADVFYQKGECHFELGEYEKAEQAYQQVLEEKPSRKREFYAKYKRALTLQKRNDLEGALAMCEKLLKKDIYFKYYQQVYLAKAGILNELGRHDEAVELYERIIELFPRTENSAEASYRLGEIYLEHYRDFSKSEEYLNKVQAEMSQSEFVEEAQKKATDMQFLRSLNFSIDSLKTDIDTLKYQLQWIAEHPQEISTDSTEIDTIGGAPPESLTVKIPDESILKSTAQPEYPPEMRPDRSGREPRGNLPGGLDRTGREYNQPAGRGQSSAVPGEIKLEPLPRDSASIYERIVRDEKSLKEFRFRLAEHLWTQFADFDSAEIILQELCEDTTVEHIQAKALLALHHFLKVKLADSANGDSILLRIHQQFPDSEYDRWVRPRLGLEPLPEPVDSPSTFYQNAENLWLEQNQSQAAIGKYRELAQTWPESEWASKALYATAWIQEHVLEDIPSALVSYDSLLAKYPQSEYAAIARNKIAPPPPELPDTVATDEDTTAKALIADQFGPVPSGSGPPEIIGGEKSLTDAIHKNHLYPLVAMEAAVSGIVIVNFTVDEQGVASNFEIIQEEPDGFDFGEMAIRALRSVKFRPGYRNNEYIQSPTTQRVQFTP